MAAAGMVAEAATPACRTAAEVRVVAADRLAAAATGTEAAATSAGSTVATAGAAIPTTGVGVMASTRVTTHTTPTTTRIMVGRMRPIMTTDICRTITTDTSPTPMAPI